jgi:hypothetical protein
VRLGDMTASTRERLPPYQYLIATVTGIEWLVVSRSRTSALRSLRNER